MYHEYTQEQLRAYCRTYIETLEVWARRLIHEKMTEKYGDNYIFLSLEDGNFLVKKEIRDHVSHMLSIDPQRFNRHIDTLFIDHLVYFLCNEKWYKELFKSALDYAYPQGRDEAYEFLNRLIPIRNPLSHSNVISMHAVERAICYSHDFIESLKKYYKERGEEQVWNVPRIIKVKDSLGNVFENSSEEGQQGAHFHLPQNFNCGDVYSVEVEVDSSFPSDSYSIRWAFNAVFKDEFTNKAKYITTFTPKDVGTSRIIWCWIESKKDWHKYGSHDSKINLHFTVLPPVE